MEMENTRRSIDKSREHGVKKPRLVEDTGRDRGLNGVIDRDRSFSSSRPSLATTGQVPSRLKNNERERDVERNDSVRGAVQSQQQVQHKSQQQNQELLSQYKTALAELTFNSKPIITNLTIIAGENLQVAKWIAATVCANILEVPSEQKLPSLYLLDSIVKNIGRDYIKYFAAKLPEVFCKAYRQVDSSIHPGMRHLFGTWRTVFPPDCLQMIEKELGFPPAVNGSASGAMASRSESQSQRPAHSIHVNPKYLEARQRSLQQSNRVKGVSGNNGTSVPSDDEDAERHEKSTAIGSKRPWTDLPMKELKHSRRESSNESLHEKNSAGYEDNEYGSDLSRNSDLGYVRAGERVTKHDGRDNSWYGADKNATEGTAIQRETFDSQHQFSKYRASLPGVAAAQVQQKAPTQSIVHSGSRVMNKNWQNSEEEEYMWDDMSSMSSGLPRKEGWNSDDAEKTEIEDHHRQMRGEIDTGSRIHEGNLTEPLSLGHRGQTTFGHHISSAWPSQESRLGDGSKLLGVTSRNSGQSEGKPSSSLGGLSTGLGASLPRTGLHTLTGMSVGGSPTVGSLVNTVSSVGILGQKRATPSGQSSMLLHPPSPSSSSLHQHQESHNLIEEDQAQTWSPSLPGQTTAHHSLHPSRTYNSQPGKNSFPVMSQKHIQPGGLQNFQSQPSPSMQLSQRQNHNPFSLQSLPELTSSQPYGQIQKPLAQLPVVGNPTKIGHSVLSHTSNSAADVPGQTNTSSVLATLMKSGILSNNSVSGGFPNLKFQDSGILPPHLNTRPPLPSGPPPTQLATSSPVVTPDSVLDPLGTHSSRTAALPPLPPGPPPASSVSGTSSQQSSTANSVSNPFQSLLSSLVAKGLISPEKEPPKRSASHVPSLPLNQHSALTTRCSLPVNPSPSTILVSSSGNDLSFPESAAKNTPSLQSTKTESKDLIGTEFKADIIRQSHPSVIDGLFNELTFYFTDLTHQCSICGLRFKLRERLELHMEWHASRKPEANSSRVSRRWYANSADWVHGKVKPSSGPNTTSSKGLVEEVEDSEPVVPADETQCVCMLCGEPFEDLYSHERDEWMFKGAVYMPIPAVAGEFGSAEGTIEGPIVHNNCVSPNSVYDLGLMKNVKQE